MQREMCARQREDRFKGRRNSEKRYTPACAFVILGRGRFFGLTRYTALPILSGRKRRSFWKTPP
jgi:hypothetical protein